MYYKILKDNKIVDVLDNLIYVKWYPLHNTTLLAAPAEAQGIMASDCNSIWHLEGTPDFPVKCDTAQIEEITEKEYHQLKALNGMTPQEIIDEYTLQLIAEGVI